MKPETEKLLAGQRLQATAMAYADAIKAQREAQQKLYEALKKNKPTFTYDELAGLSGLSRDRVRQVVKLDG